MISSPQEVLLAVFGSFRVALRVKLKTMSLFANHVQCLKLGLEDKLGKKPLYNDKAHTLTDSHRAPPSLVSFTLTEFVPPVLYYSTVKGEAEWQSCFSSFRC